MKRFVNVACGAMHLDTPLWTNLDYSSTSEYVQRADLGRGLPLPEQSYDCIYSSHFIEHLPHDTLRRHLRECHRVLRSGGALRIVTPDFENMCAEYLQQLRTGERSKAAFAKLSIVDQLVRRRRGGRLNDVLSGIDDPSLSEYVRDRTGMPTGPLATTAPILNRLRSAHDGRTIDLARARAKLFSISERAWIRGVTSVLPSAFREQNVSFADVGERHHWLWDLPELSEELVAAGFERVQRVAHDLSTVDDFPCFPLDTAEDGGPRKGGESMYVEAWKA